MKVTMQQVADRAGVDKATVSRVLRGDHRISEKTKIKVMESVRALDYKLDRNARNLSTSRSGLIGIVVDDLNKPWLGAFLAGIERAFCNSEYEILLKSTQKNAQKSRHELNALDGRHIEGLIWCDRENFPADPGVPCIFLCCCDAGGYSVTMENENDVPNFETGVLTGRMLLKIIAGKPVPGKRVIIKSSCEPEEEPTERP